MTNIVGSRNRLGMAVIYLLAILVTVVSVFPFFYAVSTSLKTGAELFSTDLMPASPTLRNYVELFTVAEQPFGRHIVNSIMVSVAVANNLQGALLTTVRAVNGHDSTEDRDIIKFSIGENVRC